MADLKQLSADFTKFQGDFSTFVTNVKDALAKLSAGGLTADQQAIIDNVDSGMTQMDTAISAITFPGASETPAA